MTKEMKQLLYCLDGWVTDLNNNNFGVANEWLRHIRNAYVKVRDEDEETNLTQTEEK